jgi:hypothetical protein
MAKRTPFGLYSLFRRFPDATSSTKRVQGAVGDLLIHPSIHHRTEIQEIRNAPTWLPSCDRRSSATTQTGWDAWNATSRVFPQVLEYGFWMKKEGYAKSTIEGYADTKAFSNTSPNSKRPSVSSCIKGSFEKALHVLSHPIRRRLLESL